MKSAVSWSIEGVAPQARESARQAARRAGMSVGEWLNAAIIDSAGDDVTQAPPPAAGSEESPRRLADAIGRLSERLEHLIEGQAAAGEYGPADSSARLPAAPAPDRWTLGIDQAVAEIAARQRSLDGTTAATGPRHADQPPEAPAGGPYEPASFTEIPMHSVSGLEQHLRHISEQIETLRRPCPFDGDVAGMRRDLGDIKHTLAQAMPRCAVEVLEEQIRKLTSRVDQERRGTDGVALAGVELRLARLYDALNRLAPAENLSGLEEEVSALSRKIDTVASIGTDPATMQQLETAITELRRVSERVASGDALTKLANEVRSVAEKVDRLESGFGGADAVSALERRMEALGGTLAEYASNVGRSAAPNVEALFTNVSERLERLQATRAEQDAFHQLEGQIARLADKLEQSDGRMAQLGGLERTLADLFLQIEDTRTGAIEAAERAAKAAARELTTTEAGDQVAVEVLQRELTELRESQSESDRRTQQTLEAVHDAVSRIVDRMADTEFSRPADTRASRLQAEAPLAPSYPTPPRPPAVPTVASPPTAPAAAPSRPASPPLPPAPVAERRPIDPSLPADTPIEPGSAGPRNRPGSPAERIAASEAALGPAKPNAPERNEKANFIAAARRAAQAAAADAAATEAPSGSEAETRSGGIGQVLGKHRRSLLMAIAAVVILAGTLQVTTRFLRTLDAPPAEAAQTPPQADTPATQVATAPAMNMGADPMQPPATVSATSGAGQNTAGIPASLSAGLAPINAPTDITGSMARPQNPAALTPPTPAASLLAPPATANPDPAKLPAAIGSASLRTAAASGDAAAAYEIAIRFAEGRGVPLNLEEAVRWFQRAADRGIAPAQYRLGSLYEKGQGVKKDIEAARQLYTAAADKGNAKAMHNLAVLFAEGINGKPDYRTAGQWFRKAAERGVADSQYNLGILYARGIGIEQSIAESYKWFALAAAQGDTDAGRKRDDLAARLDPQALAAAKLAVQTFTPEAQPDEAINVRTPPGGWDRATSASAPVKPKTAPARKTGSI